MHSDSAMLVQRLAQEAAKGVRAVNPKRSRARSTSSMRRGWPLGRVPSQRTSPEKPEARAMVSASSRMEISKPAPRLTGSGSS